MNPYLKSTRRVVGKNNEKSTPLWIYLLSVLPLVIAIALHYFKEIN